MFRSLRFLSHAEVIISEHIAKWEPQLLVRATALRTSIVERDCASRATQTGLQSTPLSALCSSLHTFQRSLQTQAEIWTWGKAEEGQLGHATENVEKQPRRVDALVYTTHPSSQGLAVSSDLDTDVATTSEHEDHPRAGNPSSDSASQSASPSNVWTSDGSRFVGQVSCGLFHSAALLDGHLFMWGKGQGGRLGIGNDQPRYQPARVPLADVSSVDLGGLHSLAVTKGEVTCF
jgi:alpha-tubulin suppressor-like RCC1 family protein